MESLSRGLEKMTSFNFLDRNMISKRGDQFNLYVFDIRYQKHFSSARNKKLAFKFSTDAAHVIPAGAVA